MEFGKPLARLVVPSIGSTAISKRGEPGFQVPSLSPRNSPGALSLAPSPMTTSPAISTKSKTPLMASQAAASAFSLSPRPSQGTTLRAAFSVARTNSNSIVRSGSMVVNDSCIVQLRALVSWDSAALSEQSSLSARAAGSNTRIKHGWSLQKFIAQGDAPGFSGCGPSARVGAAFFQLCNCHALIACCWRR